MRYQHFKLPKLDECEEGATLAPNAAKKYADIMVESLLKPPHFAVLGGLSPINSTKTSEAIATLIAGGRLSSPKKISFTNVRVVPGKEVTNGASTSYSRTHLPLALHSDSSYLATPHNVMAFQMVRNDAEGGESLMASVEDVIAALDEETISVLQKFIFPFGQEYWPILWQKLDGWHIRYYRTQLDTMISDGRPVSEEALKAMQKLDAVLADENLWTRFRLKPGEVLFLHNTKSLHGRTGMAKNSERLMYRLRIHSDRLEAASQALSASALVRDASGVPIDPLSRAYYRVRKAPQKPLLRIELGELLLEERRINLALRHFDLAWDLLGQSPVEKQRYAKRMGANLFKAGGFKQAIEALKIQLVQDKSDREAYKLLSAAYDALGDLEMGLQQADKGARLSPFDLPGKLSAEKPNVLSLRGVHGIGFKAKQRGGKGVYSRKIKGGHFRLDDLIRFEEFNELWMSISSDSVAAVAGCPKPDIIINTVACPDLAPITLEEVVKVEAAFPGVPVINPAQKVLETTRLNMSKAIGAIDGVRFPKTLLLDVTDDIDGLAAKIEAELQVYPVILRLAGTQTGISVELAQNREAVLQYLKTMPKHRQLYAIEYVNCLGVDGYYHKMRAFFIDGQFYPVANLTSDDWQIHSGDRYRVMDKLPDAQVEEKRYLNTPIEYLGEKRLAALHKIRDIVGLDFFGMDYVRGPDDSIIVFEVNAAMRHNYDHAGNFPYTRPHLRRISNAFHAMVEARAKSRVEVKATIEKSYWGSLNNMFGS